MLNKTIKNTILFFWNVLVVIILISILYLLYRNLVTNSPFDMKYVLSLNGTLSGSILYLLISAISFIILFILYKLFKRYNIKLAYLAIYPIILIIISRIITMFIIPDANMVSDYATMRNAALSILKYGLTDQSLLYGSQYFKAFPYLVPYVILQAGLMKIFGQGIVVTQIFNILLSLMTIMLIYAISMKLTRSHILSILAMTIYSLIPSSMIFTLVAMPEYIYTPLLLLFIFLTITFFSKDKINANIDKKNYMYFAWCGLMLGFLACLINMFKPFAPILIIAIFIYSTYLALGMHIKGLTKILLISITTLSLILSFSIAEKAFLYFVENKVVSANIASNKTWAWSLYVGNNTASMGLWNSDDAIYYGDLQKEFTIDAANEKLFQSTLERIEDNGIVNSSTLYMEKIGAFWGLDTDGVSFVQQMTNYKSVAYIYLLPSLIYYGLLWISIGVFTVILALNRSTKIYSTEYIFILLCMLGFTAVHMVLEVQGKYHFGLLPLICVIIVYNVHCINISKNKESINTN